MSRAIALNVLDTHDNVAKTFISQAASLGDVQIEWILSEIVQVMIVCNSSFGSDFGGQSSGDIFSIELLMH